MHSRSLSVVIPTFNEVHRLPQTLREIRPYLEREYPAHEVIVVDDRGVDGTAEAVLEVGKTWPELRLLRQPRNIGKGAAVRRGMLDARCDLILFMDADHATPITEMEKFMPFFETHGRDVVVGVRTYQDDSKWRRIVGLVLQILSHLIVFDRAVVDSQCGFKCFTADVARTVFRLSRIDGGMFDVEIFAIMQRLGIRPYYEQIRWANKAGSRINTIKCMICDPFDMMVIRFNGMLGRYGKRRVVG